MGFLEAVSQTIVEKTSKIIDYPITITNKKGYIIGSIDKKRLHTFHPVSVEVMERNEMIYYDPEKVKEYENVLPGIAAPIILNKEIIGVLGVVGKPEEVEKYARLVKSHVELLCQEYIKSEMSLLESKTLDNLIRYLLNSETKDDIEYSVRYGRMLGFNLDTNIRRISYLIEIDVGIESRPSMGHDPLTEKITWQFIQNNILDVLKYYLTDTKEDLLAMLSLDQFILIKTMQRDESPELFGKRMEYNLKRLIRYLHEEYSYSVSIAVGSIEEGPIGIKTSYHNSLKALNTGKKTKITPKIYHYNDWNILFELVGNGLDEYISERLNEKLITFLHHVNFNTLAHTFITYCNCNMNMSETARILFLHRNSLVYRMEKIRELTCLDISRFDHCLLLYFSIKNSHYISEQKDSDPQFNLIDQ